MTDRPTDTASTLLRESERAFRANLDHALRRQAEVDANPAPQRWEVVHARDAVTRATAALAAIAVQSATLAHGA